MPAPLANNALPRLAWLLILAIVLFLPLPATVLGALAAVQLALWLQAGLSLGALWQALRRLRFFALIIVLVYVFSAHGSEPQWVELDVGIATFRLNLAGFAVAGLMCLRVATLVTASAWLQRSSAPGALPAALRALGLPQMLALVVDASLHILAGDGSAKGARGKRHGGGGGRGGGAGRGGGMGRGMDQGRGAGGTGTQLRWAEIRRGDLGFVTRLLQEKMHQARAALAERYPELPPERVADLALILAICLAVMGLKLLQVLPGLPVAPGHKNLLVIPLLLLAAHASRMPFGGTLAGTAIGIVSFMLGYGKFGLLEVFHFAVPGLLADLLMPFARLQSRSGRLIQFALLGALLGAARFAANFLVIVLAGAPAGAFLLYAPMLLSQVIFGALSCFVSLLIVRTDAIGPNPEHEKPDGHPSNKDPETEH